MTTSSGFFCVLQLIVRLNPMRHNGDHPMAYIAARPLAEPGLRWLRSELRRSAAIVYEYEEAVESE